MLLDGSVGNIDLYEILGIQKSATKTEIKKAYHKAALSSHPDKVAEEDRSAAEIRFKSVGKAYEILYDDEKRRLYNLHGMEAFGQSHGHGMGTGVDLDEMLHNMFGMGGQVPSRFSKQRKGEDEEHPYQVSLEELYKGKTAKFTSKKNVICNHCKGSGGREKAKPKQCGSCRGQGFTEGLASIAPGLFTSDMVMCNSCKGVGTILKDKDRCKKCKGERVTEAREVLEIYIPRGSKEGDKIVLEGEADQVPGQEPGDIIFSIVELEHSVFRRAGADLSADLEITLAEALCGFSRIIVRHLGGRGLLMNHHRPKSRIMRPGQVIKFEGEGMPYKKSELRGDLYMTVHVKFPEDGWLRDDTLTKLQSLLPKPAEPIKANIVDEVEYDESASIEDFGAGAQEGEAWEDDEDDDNVEGPCPQQ
ncbi:hypothetical protein MMC07_004385 [Pseudocyphellaria aurata]|nr:hypothetical protein [Pseudocyphellaria aurata]